VVLVYFASAYALWPKLTGRRLASGGMAALQLWLWFLGMLTLTIPWHYLGLLWMPRRIAYAPYDPQIVARWQPFSGVMIAGGAMLVVSAVLFVANLLASHRSRPEETEPMAYAETLEPVVRVPALLNGFTVWNWLLVALMAISWAYPIGQFFFIGVHKALPWGVR
jgi:cytochrome c oxidase subunit 1